MEGKQRICHTCTEAPMLPVRRSLQFLAITSTAAAALIQFPLTSTSSTPSGVLVDSLGTAAQDFG